MLVVSLGAIVSGGEREGAHASVVNSLMVRVPFNQILYTYAFFLHIIALNQVSERQRDRETRKNGFGS